MPCHSTDVPFLEELPFRDLQSLEVREIYRLRLMPRARSATTGGSMLGNYVAGYVAKNLRIDAEFMGYHKFHSLSMVMDLPTDLIFEIFTHLHPIDLYSLIRTTKDLRALLLNRHSQRVWKMSFKANVGVPRCPKDIPLPKWVSLLFGPDDCDTCGTNYAMPDFAFRARFCESCMMHNYATKDSVRSTLRPHPKYNPAADIWKLLRHSCQWSGYSYWKTESRIPQYLLSDVVAREHEIQPYLDRIDADISNALEEFQQYKASVTMETKKDMEFVKFCETWCLSIHEAVKKTHVNLSGVLAKRCLSRLVKQGHDQRDVNLSALQVALHSGHITRLRGLRYRLMMKIVERWIQQASQGRRVTERKNLVESRRKAVDEIYHEFVVLNFKPTQWKCVPDGQKIRDIELFKTFINSEGSNSVLPPKESAIGEIRRFVEDEVESHKTALTFALMLATKNFQVPGSLPDKFSMIGLATSVFACLTCLSERDIHFKEDVEVKIGWEDVGRQELCVTCLEATPRRRNSDMRYNADGAKVVISLLGLLGLHPDTTTAADLDKLDPRFVCDVCSLRESAVGKKSSPVYRWRECVGHVLAAKCRPGDYVAHLSGPWVLLTEDCVKSVRFHEELLNEDTARNPCWSCTHCSAHFSENVTRKDAKNHVKNAHGITRPVVNVDYTCLRGRSCPLSERYGIGVEPLIDCRCSRCPVTNNLRLWKRDSLILHIKDKHRIQQPEEGVDWVSVELFERKGAETNDGQV